MNCCEQSGPGAGCNQGPNCPVRTSRAASAGEAYPLPVWYVGDEPKPDTFAQVTYWGAIVLVALICVAAIGGGVNYLWTTFGEQLQRVFWTTTTLFL